VGRRGAAPPGGRDVRERADAPLGDRRRDEADDGGRGGEQMTDAPRIMPDAPPARAGRIGGIMRLAY
jgi:hypothetical protein